MSDATTRQLFCKIAEGLRLAVDETSDHCVYGTRQQLLELAMEEVPELRAMVRGHRNEVILKGMCLCVGRTKLTALAFKTDFAEDDTVLAVFDLARTDLHAVKLLMWNKMRAKSVSPRVKQKPAAALAAIA